MADDSAASMIGNLLPDFVRGRVPETAAEAMAAGITLHQRVDAYTDVHEVFHRSRARIDGALTRYSGIITDVLWDHVLATDWAQYHADPLEHFIAHVYRTIRGRLDLLPEPMHVPVNRMMDEDWLGRYASIEGIESVLAMMSGRLARRFDRAVDLTPAAAVLDANIDAYRADFHAFFPELLAWLGRDTKNLKGICQG